MIVILQSLCVQLYAETLKIAVPNSVPPYVFADKNKGIEFDIVKEALKRKGIKIDPVHAPFSELKELYDDKDVDACMTCSESTGISAFFSESHINYRNVAIGLRRRSIQATKIEDLKNYEILAFAGAENFLGKEYAKVIAENNNYRETNEQVEQNIKLYTYKVDLIIADINIFKYHNRQLLKKRKFKKKIKQRLQIYSFFPITYYKVGFRNQETKDKFNEGLKEIKQDGTYQKIVDKYTKY